jgi:protein TonB
MFAQLPESRAVRRFRAGGSAASLTLHAALATFAVLLTANAGERTAPEPVERIEQLFRAPAPPPPPPQRVQQSSTRSTQPALAGTPSLTMPDIVPVDLPPIETATINTHENETIASTRIGTPGGSIAGDRTSRAVIADAAVFTATEVDKPVVLRQGSPTPEYPDMLRRAGVTGTVIAEFVVDTLGNVEVATIRLRSGDHDQFRGSVRATLPRMRFLPAQYRGMKVPQLVQLPFRFDINP